MSKILIGVSLLLLTLSAVLGVLNSGKVKGLRNEMENASAARDAANQARVAQQKELKGREASVAAATARFAQTEARMTNAEGDLARIQAEKISLQAKAQAQESEIAELKKRLAEPGPASLAEDAPGSSVAVLQAQLDETRRQLESVESEKGLLSEKTLDTQERTVPAPAPGKKRSVASGRPGLRGTVLAVNQAYNFVVLNLGERQGVEANSEMLVLRDGTLIGKIRVSSVEPTTAIGDIISSTLARGVQVQTGDNVIYAGTN